MMNEPKYGPGVWYTTASGDFNDLVATIININKCDVMLETVDGRELWYAKPLGGECAMLALRDRIAELENTLVVVHKRLLYAIHLARHYGPQPPKHTCESPNACCDCECVEYARFSEECSNLLKPTIG
jgi:hypothetical protein